MKEICHEYTIYGETDTAGNPVKHRRCFCGTTACLNMGTYKVPRYLPVGTFPFQVVLGAEKDCDCEYEMALKDGQVCQKCEKRFYDKVFATKLL